MISKGYWLSLEMIPAHAGAGKNLKEVAELPIHIKKNIMKHLLILLTALFAACNNEPEPVIETTKTDTVVIHDTVQSAAKTKVAVTNNIPKEQQEPKPAKPEEKEKAPTTTLPTKSKPYANQRFKEVTVEKIGEHKFRIKGKGQIFEAAFSWVVEDGHNELKKGFEMTDAGAPEWGNFNFVVDVAKKRANSTLHIILFESSAKDGSRQYELLIPLY